MLGPSIVAMHPTLPSTHPTPVPGTSAPRWMHGCTGAANTRSMERTGANTEVSCTTVRLFVTTFHRRARLLCRRVESNSEGLDHSSGGGLQGLGKLSK